MDDRTRREGRPIVTSGLHKIQSASRDEIEALQLTRLRWSLNHAYRGNPNYRKKFEAAGVHPEDLRSLDDLVRFPFTTKADLRSAYPFGFFAVPNDQLVRLHASSGTTGKPTVVGYTQEDIATWSSLVARSLHAAGARPGMRVHIAYGYGLFTGGLGAHYGAEALGCIAIPVSGGQTERQVQLITDLTPSVVMATPSYMLSILDEMRRQGIDPTRTSLKIGVFGAEPWTEAMRGELEAALGIEAVDIYGLSEVMGPGVASEYAETKGGPTMWEDHFLPEIVDPETGTRLADGETGELVFTSLTKQAMPVIRYRTRDLCALLPGAVGSMRRMARITGRSDDMMIVRGVNLFPGQIEEQILGCASLSPYFQVELSRDGRLDRLLLVVEGRLGAEPAQCARDAKQLEARVKTMTGLTATVEIRPSGSLPRSQGKAARVIDHRKTA